MRIARHPQCSTVVRNRGACPWWISCSGMGAFYTTVPTVRLHPNFLGPCKCQSSLLSARFLSITPGCTTVLYEYSSVLLILALCIIIYLVASGCRYGMWTGNTKHSRFSSFFVSAYSPRQLFDQMMEKARAEESERLRRGARISSGGF